MKSWHVLLCMGFIAAGAILVATGAEVLAVLPFIGCALMMGLMMWMMMRSGGQGGGGG